MRKILVGLLAVAFVGFTGFDVALWTSHAEDAASRAAGEEAAAADAAADASGDCCTKDDTTPPLELIKNTPRGGLRNPYNDDVEAMKELGHKTYLKFGCNGCHGGGGGGGMCMPLTNDTWVYGGDDDTLFRLIALGTDDLKKQGYKRVRTEVVVGPMPPFGGIIKTSDDLWKVIAWFRVVNPSSMKLVDKPAQ